MRRLFAVLALAALVAACSDQPTAPAPDGPQFANWGAEHGAWILRSSAEDIVCSLWDGDGVPTGPVPCTVMVRATPSNDLNFGRRMSVDAKVSNSTGRAVHFGPYNYPPFIAESFESYMVPQGENGPPTKPLALCDYDRSNSIQCTYDWHMTVSASGKVMLIANFKGPIGIEPMPI